MRNRLVVGFALAAAVMLPGVTAAQSPSPTPALAMPRAVQAAYAAGTRSADGNPGPNYWQNSSVHDIQLTVMPPDRAIHATQTITYTNNAPFELAAVPIRLYQNVHRPTAMREKVYPPEFLTDGITIDSFKVNGQDVPFTPDPRASGETIKIIPLPEPIPAGGQATFDIAWHFDLAQFPVKEGVIDPTSYFIAYFFPRIAPIRDDEGGDPLGLYRYYDTEEFTYRSGRELNNDFADFNVSVTVPKDFAVWATGELQNPDEVLQADAAKKYADSLTSDQTITIATPAELAAGSITAQTDTVTWQWKAQNVMDFVLGLSDHFTWDAGSVVGDPATGARVGLQAAYPDSAAANFAPSVADQADVITYATTQWPAIAWPYPRSSVFVGGADEEYPMMANDSAEPPFPGSTVNYVAAHELYHQFFPFLMGINEQRYPILDEGWTTALDSLYNTQELPPGVNDQVFGLLRVNTQNGIWTGVEIPAITAADALRGPSGSENAYGKASMAYLALKSLLGDETFKTGLQAFIERWQGKHPLPWDMFNTFDQVTGQDLTWFWQNWFYSDHYVDLGITGVNQTADGWTVDVINNGGFAIPATLVAAYADGTLESIPVGVATWKDATAVTIPLTAGKEPTAVQIQSGPFLQATQADFTWTNPNPPAAPSPAASPAG
ncbi:MAG: M1 family metallopeptidase [Chloroflexota bacterium]